MADFSVVPRLRRFSVTRFTFKLVLLVVAANVLFFTVFHAQYLRALTLRGTDLKAQSDITDAIKNVTFPKVRSDSYSKTLLLTNSLQQRDQSMYMTKPFGDKTHVDHLHSHTALTFPKVRRQKHYMYSLV
jgi:hypothetical protein